MDRLLRVTRTRRSTNDINWCERSHPASYSVSALTDLCNGMNATLIVLQIELEDISAGWARRLEAQAWDILRMGVDRRQVSLRGL